MKPSDDLEKYLELKIFPEPMSGCWIWTGNLDTAGYPKFWLNKKMIRTHRFLKERQLGRSILPGLLACHHCDVRCCVNPAHIFEGTISENSLDSFNKGRVDMLAKSRLAAAKKLSLESCRNGHPYTPENTATRPGRPRRCRTCSREQCARARSRQLMGEE